MGRILFQYVLPILLPIAIYVAWLAAERRRVVRAGTGQPPRWQDAPWVWLVVAGVLLATVAAFAVALMGGDSIEGQYVPPRIENGRIIPGHVEPRPTAR